MPRRAKPKRLTPIQRDAVRARLADGQAADAICDVLGLELDQLAELLESPAARNLTDEERALIGWRNAMLLFESERERLFRFQQLVPEGIPKNGHRQKAIEYLDHCRVHAESARRHLDSAHKWADLLAKISTGSALAEWGGFVLPIVADETGDFPASAGEAVSDDRDSDD